MSLKKVGTITRALWNNGNRTPLVRSSNGSSTRCDVNGTQGSEKHNHDNEQRCGSNSYKSTTGAASSSAAHRKQVGTPTLKVDQKTYLWARYNEMRRLVHGKY